MILLGMDTKESVYNKILYFLNNYLYYVFNYFIYLNNNKFILSLYCCIYTLVLMASLFSHFYTAYYCCDKSNGCYYIKNNTADTHC